MHLYEYIIFKTFFEGTEHLIETNLNFLISISLKPLKIDFALLLSNFTPYRPIGVLWVSSDL